MRAAACYEIDETLHGALTETLSEAAELAASVGRCMSWSISSEDYILEVAGQAARLLGAGDVEPFGAVIMNPPYRKINGGSPKNAV